MADRTEIRALPLWQPWASLVVHGAKKIETRHWPAPRSIIGQRIAIHATKTRSQLRVVRTEPFRRVLRELLDAGAPLMDPANQAELPLGALIGTVVVASCERMSAEGCSMLEYLEPDEYAFGHHAPGRYGWYLEDPKPLAAPVPWRGSQGVFSVPASVVGVELADPQETLL